MKHYSLSEILRALESEKNMPGALYADAAQTARHTAETNPDYAWVLSYLQEQITLYEKTPIVLPTFQQYANFDRAGERHGFDSVMYTLRTRLNTMALAVLMDIPGSRTQYEDILYAFLHLPTWSLSAHLLDHSREDYWDIPRGPYDETGHVRGLGRGRRQSLDLCSTSAAFMLCEMAQLLEGKIEPCLIRWSRQECYERILSNFMSLSPFPHFEINPNNWSGVCMASIGAAAIYLITEERTLAPLLQRVLEALAVHESGYNADGASPEGFGYWQYGFEYYLMFADLLYRRTGGRIDLMADEKMRRVAGFGADCCFGKKLKLPFGDVNWQDIFDEAVGRFVGHMGIPVPPQGDTKASFLHAFEHGPLQLRHLVWTMQPAAGALDFPRSTVYQDSEYFMGFYHSKEDPVYLLAKGGNNGESHNHNDVGSFVIIRGDKMLAADTSGGDYCREYFSEKRYTFFATRSGGHNVPLVGGVEQEGNGNCRARAFQVEQGEDADNIMIDLTGTLCCPALSALTRRISGDRKTGSVVVRDTFDMITPAEIRDRVVILEKPALLHPGVLRIGGENGMTLRFDADSLDCQVTTVNRDAVYAPVAHDAPNRPYMVDLVPKTEKSGQVTIEMRWDLV